MSPLLSSAVSLSSQPSPELAPSHAPYVPHRASRRPPGAAGGTPNQVLFLTQLLPYPLDSGAKIRAYYVLRQLAQQHDVTLVSFVRRDDAPQSAGHLASFCRDVRTVRMRRSPLHDARALLRSILAGMPVIIARDEMAQMHDMLHQLVARTSFDVVHADQTSMAQYALYARSAARQESPPRLVLDAHNALYRVPARMATHQRNSLKRALFRREARLLRRYEEAAYAQFDHVVFVTRIDRNDLFGPPAAISSGGGYGNLPHSRLNDDGLQRPPEDARPATSVIPICVDPSQKPLIQPRSNPALVTHLGTMVWPPNAEGVLWFAREVWPRVVDRVPQACFTVIGKDPPRDVRQLPVETPNVEVTGYLADPRPYLAQTAVFVVPLRAGGGMRVKIIDAWCWGLPVVSTSIGAEGLAVREGQNILIADRPAALADAIVRILHDPALAARLRENGRRWVEGRYDWRQVYHQWDHVYNSVTRARLETATEQ